MKSTEKSDTSAKPSLLADAEEEEADTLTSIYLNLTTKKHIADKKRLKPTKIAIPHPLNTSATTTICLITCEPQRTYKDIITSPAFPQPLGARITRVIDFSKLKTKYKQYEAQRQLRDSHDLFLADDRIITRLPGVLGKTFYKATHTRPIPVSLQATAPRTDGKRIARAKGGPKAGSAKEIAHEIEKAIQATLVHLSPSTSTAVRVGYASWTAEQIADNVAAVVTALVEKSVPQKWRGVKSLHIKGPNTMALPIWLADELWVDAGDVIDEEVAQKAIEANMGKKRKAILGGEEVEKTSKKQKVVDGDDDKLDKEIALRREALKKQKVEAAKSVEDGVPKATKKSKKGKAVAV
jgi:ribosome biogenesis protein UTP30